MSRRAIAFLAVLSLAACLIALPAARAGDVSHARIVRLSYTLGDVQSRADDSSSWQKAVVNTPLREGMSLATGDGRAEVEFEIGAMVWMASNTVVKFPQLVLEDGAKITQLEVKQGTATIYLNPGRHDSFVVHAGELLVMAPDTTRFRVDVFDDGASVSVQRGAVDVSAQGVTQHVSGHTTLAFRDGSAKDALLSANPHSDAWDRWVSDRSSAVGAALTNSSDRLDAPFSYGMADLSFYGGWMDLPGYGMGWQPYGVGLGWSPFYNGYFDFFGGYGPTWISYEPWGWLPYHYGGWVFSPVYGWVWVPGGFGAWSPATVYWVGTPTGIGWVARAPHDTATGTPANLSHGVITNTPAGIVGGSRNTVLRGAQITGVQAVGSWTSNAELVRFSQQAQLQAHATTPDVPRSVHPAQRMPEGTAPRIATAGMYAGHVQRYSPPGAARGAGHGIQSGAASYGGSGTSSSMGSSDMRGGAASTHSGGSGVGSGGSHGGKP